MRECMKGRPDRAAWLIVVALIAAMVAVGCGSSSDDSSSGERLGTRQDRQGRGRAEPGRLGRLRRERLDRPERRLGQRLREGDRLPGQRQGRPARPTRWSQLMRTGQYDGVSASGNATARLVAGGDVDPVNTDLVPNYKTVFADIKDQSYNTFDGQPYGIPHGRGADLLMWNSDDVKPAPNVVGRDARSREGIAVQGQDLASTTTRSTSPTPPCT